MRKQLFLAAIALVGVSFSSCDKEPKPQPAGPASVSIQIGEKTLESIAVKFTPNSNTISFEFAIGQESDLAAFNDGTLEGIVNIDNREVKNHTFEGLTEDTEYTIFAAGVNADGVRGETKTRKASTVAPAPVEPNIEVTFDNITIPIAEVTFTPNESCGDTYYAMFASKDIWNNVMLETGTYEERLEMMQMYVDFGLTNEYNGITSDKFILNGYADYEFLLIVLIYDLEGNAIYKEFEFLSPSLDTSLELPSPIEIDLVSVTETVAEISFTPGDNTIGFYYALFTKANYEELCASAANRTDGLSEENHVKEYIAFYGTTSLEAVTDTWAGQPAGTEFVVVAAPFNGNGAEYQYGYGALATYEFSTLGTAAEAPNKISLREQTKKAALRNKLIGLKK